ncbi:hypothetical protein [Streptomyces pseudogriseolus]|uniref:hypothetical protein n=1 Tax=Streptomyces pseudogriseolus TaxID=36817 RepID=UPI003FA235C9
MRATMRNFRIRWTEDGRPRESAVSYSERVAEREVAAKRDNGAVDVEMFEVDPMTGEELVRS